MRPPLRRPAIPFLLAALAAPLLPCTSYGQTSAVQSVIDANVPAQAAFDALLQRDLTAYFRATGSPTATAVEWTLLRQQPMRRAASPTRSTTPGCACSTAARRSRRARCDSPPPSARTSRSVELRVPPPRRSTDPERVVVVVSRAAGRRHTHARARRGIGPRLRPFNDPVALRATLRRSPSPSPTARVARASRRPSRRGRTSPSSPSRGARRCRRSSAASWRRWPGGSRARSPS